MEELKNIKNKFLTLIRKKKPADTASALPVRVNLPLELGGGFTMLMCFLKGGQSVRDFIKSLITMLQNTNAILLKAEEYGLTPHAERDEDGLDDQGLPPTFLHPESLLADAFEYEEELNLDLRRLKPIKKEESAAATENGTSDESKSNGTHPAADPGPPPFRMPILPTPPSHTVLHFNALSKLKRLKPPVDPPLEVIVVSTFIPPCSLPPHLAISLPEHMQIGALTSSLQVRPAAKKDKKDAAASSSTVAASSSSATVPPVPVENLTKAEKKERKAAEKLQKKLDEYAAHIYDMLLARSIGEDPHVKLQMAAALAHSKAHKDEGERIGTSTATGNDSSGAASPNGDSAAPAAWGGWDEDNYVETKSMHKHEIPLLFISTKKVPMPPPKKFDVTADCFVITNQRCVQVENGTIVEELALGPDSGNMLKLPKETEAGNEPDKCPIHLIVRNAIETEREEAAAADANGDEEGEEQPPTTSTPDANGASTESTSAPPPSSRRARARANYSKPASRIVTFYVPNEEIAGFCEEYLMYFQEKVLLESQLGLIEQARLDRIEHFNTERCLRGWTYLLKSLVGPIIFGPLRQPVYENSIKQVLAKVQQMDIKQVELKSLKLIEFKIPELDAQALTSKGKEGDQIPALRLADYQGHPHHTYIFDIFWSAPSFYIKVEITGKKIFSFKLELEMKGVEVRGSLRLRSSPYEPEKAAVSFVSVPQLSFGVGSHVIVGSVKLPFQRAIEKIIYQQIQAAIEGGLKENVVGDKWQSIYYEKSGLSLLLDRWWGISQYPFKYDGTDDEDMMSLALVVTSQAETGLTQTVKEMRANRDKMQKCLGHRPGSISHNNMSDESPTPKAKKSSKEKDKDKEKSSSDKESPTKEKLARKKSVSKLPPPAEEEEDEPPAPPSKKEKKSSIASASPSPPAPTPTATSTTSSTSSSTTATSTSAPSKKKRRPIAQDENDSDD